MLRELLRPFSYLTIRHTTRMPLWVNWIVPVGLSFIAVLLPLSFSLSVNLFGDNGLVARVLGFVQSLAGFYVAALAAIATFNNPDMDKLMPGKPPTMEVSYNGSMSTVQVTRRRFLSCMFAYLTGCSVLLTLISVTALAIAPPVAIAIPEFLVGPAKLVFISLFIFLLTQMICVTFWGLFYLGERIHTPDK
jgi:hypothetical protein